MGPSHHLVVAVAATLVLLAAQVGAQDGLWSPLNLLLSDPTNSMGNVSTACLTRWPNNQCPDPDLRFYLYSGHSGESEEMNVTDPTWLGKSRYNSSLPTVMLVHGYRGGDSLGPTNILKHAYRKRGTHNVIMVDWGAFVKYPCYIQSVLNIRSVSKCIGSFLSVLEQGGVATENVTCVGHSLGAHLCGGLATFAPKKLNTIVALNPARPLMGTRPLETRLDAKDAAVVQVIHTSTGFYGLPNEQGTVDFCVNDGTQPFCKNTTNPQLCGDLHSVCFFAESLFPGRSREAAPCEQLCPQAAPTNSSRAGDHVTMGHGLERGAVGMYCVQALEAPYCLNPEVDPEYGDPSCCPS